MPDRSRHASNDSGSSHCEDALVSSLICSFSLLLVYLLINMLCRDLLLDQIN